ncbi:hypothetical protein ACN47E_005154 [Coniothyrium glycines]
MAPSPRDHFSSNGTSHLEIYVYLSIGIVAVLILKTVGQQLFSPLRSVPGPFLARFTRLWELYASRKCDYPIWNKALHEKYGPIVRLAPNRYSINDAEAARTILGIQNALDKSAFYYPFGHQDMPNVFSEQSNTAHSITRRPQAQLYSTTNLLNYEPFVDNCNTILLRRLEECAREHTELDVRQLMQFYAFDVIGEITVGSRFGLMEDNGDKSGIIQILHDGLDISSAVGFVPEMHWWIGKISSMLKLSTSFDTVINFAEVHIQDRVSGRTKSPDDRRDFIDKLLPLEQAGKTTRALTNMVCQQNVGAGSDTTAISLSTTIAFLAMHPEYLATLRKELDDARAQGKLSDPAQYNEAQKLPYLQAVIYEAMRVHPAVGMPMARVVGKGGAELAGRYFPAGTEVGVNAWVLHSNKDVYGPDAEAFRPDRWLTKDPVERATMDRNFLSFGAGTRTCIGKNISLLEMYKVIPQIVSRYDFELIQDKKTGNVFTWTTRWFAKPDFKCLVRRRETTKL